MAEAKKKAATEKKAAPVKTESDRGNRQTQDGLVVSNKMEKTVVVAVVRQITDFP